MQKLLTTKTASLTDLRDPMKVIESAGVDTVAILNRNKVVAYLIPEGVLANRTMSPLPQSVFDAVLKETLESERETITYLKDK